MNYILYLGPDDFRGLIGGLPERPNVTLTCTEDCQGECGDFCPVVSGAKEQLRQWGLQVESLKANAPKVVGGLEKVVIISEDGKVFHVNPHKPVTEITEIKIGDSFPLPEGLEFNKNVQVRHGVEWYDLPNQTGGIYKSILRIVKTDALQRLERFQEKYGKKPEFVKTEVKEGKEDDYPIVDNLGNRHIPSPEESQKELISKEIEKFIEYSKYFVFDEQYKNGITEGLKLALKIVQDIHRKK